MDGHVAIWACRLARRKSRQSGISKAFHHLPAQTRSMPALAYGAVKNRAGDMILRVFMRLGLYTFLLASMSCYAQDRIQARSMVLSRHGIVATSQTLASQAGAQILARGGSAVDAAIAANAVLGVVEPMSNGIGGDLFAIYWDAKTGKLSAINASGWAPKAFNLEFLRARGLSSMPQEGIHSVTVP